MSELKPFKEIMEMLIIKCGDSRHVFSPAPSMTDSSNLFLVEENLPQLEDCLTSGLPHNSATLLKNVFFTFSVVLSRKI